MIPARWMVAVGAATAGMIAGLSLGWGLWSGVKTPTPESYAKEIRQKDGSIIAERKPGALQPAAEIPKGATVERVVKVTLRPSATPTGDTAIPGSGAPSATGEVTLDLSLVQLADGSHRAIVSSTDGTIRAAVDSPTSTEAPTKPRVWALGAVVGVGQAGEHTRGLFLERDLGPWRVGVDILRRTHLQQSPSWEGLVRVGLRW